jgi:hypothetical protein
MDFNNAEMVPRYHRADIGLVMRLAIVKPSFQGDMTWR